MKRTSTTPIRRAEHNAAEIQALNPQIASAPDQKIRSIVATVDSMTIRGLADQLIEPLRDRLAALRPPHPLRFSRLLFYPLDLLIVPIGRWRREQAAIPRAALRPMAEHVRLTMGADAAAIEAQTVGHTTADTDLIARLGRVLWPAAADILAASALPRTWFGTSFGNAAYPPLAQRVATLLAEAVALDALCAETAPNLPPPLETIEAMLQRVARRSLPTLPMMITLLLGRLPQAGPLLARTLAGPPKGAVHAAMDQAADLLLGRLDRAAGAETRIAAAPLAEAGATVCRMLTLLEHLRDANLPPKRRERLRAVRQRLDIGCQTRFTAGLQHELLAPLQDPAIALDPVVITGLESAARSLRVLETEARAIGGGPTYDRLLASATETVKAVGVRDRLSPVDKLRLIEILAGSDAALAILDQP